MKLEYKLFYNQYSTLGGTTGYILKNRTFETKKELKEFIKKELKEEDKIRSIHEVKTKRLDIEEFRK